MLKRPFKKKKKILIKNLKSLFDLTEFICYKIISFTTCKFKGIKTIELKRVISSVTVKN